MEHYTLTLPKKAYAYEALFFWHQRHVIKDFSSFRRAINVFVIFSVFLLLFSNIFSPNPSGMDFFISLYALIFGILMKLIGYMLEFKFVSPTLKVYQCLFDFMLSKETYLNSVTFSEHGVFIKGFVQGNAFEYSLSDNEYANIRINYLGIILPVSTYYVYLPISLFENYSEFRAIQPFLKQ